MNQIIEKKLYFFKNNFVIDTILTTILSTIGRGVGFLIPFFIAGWFGVNAETDAFFFTYGIILFFAGIFAPVVESVIVPYIAEARVNNENIAEFVSSILSLSGIGLLILLIFFLLLIKPLLPLITRFDSKVFDLIYQLLIEISPLIIFLIWTSILAGTLNAYKKFFFPALSPAFRAIINLTVIFLLKSRLGVHSIAIGYLTGEFVRLLTLIYRCKKILSLKIKLCFQLTSKLKDFFMKGLYQVVGMVSVGLNPVIDKTMGSWLGTGSVSILYYADRLYMIPVTFATTGLMVTILSHWSEKFYSQSKNIMIINNEVNKTIKILIFPIFIITMILILFSQTIIEFTFHHGAFPQNKLIELKSVWICYLIGMPGYIIGLIIVRAYLVLRYTNILMKISFFTIIINILFNLILMPFFGNKGIALSTSITTNITTLIQYILLINIIKEANYEKKLI